MFLNFIIIIGSIISIMNFYISINKNINSSGIPIIGSLVLFISLFFIKNNILGYILILIIFIDTGGLHWFIFSILFHNFKNK